MPTHDSSSLSLGATRTAALWLVLKDGLAMVATGAVIGLLGAWATQTFIRGILFGISPLARSLSRSVPFFFLPLRRSRRPSPVLA